MKKQKITIRKAKVGDEKKAIEYLNECIESNAWKYTGSNSAPKKEDLEKIRNQYKNNGKGEIYILAIDKGTKKIIGSCSGKFKLAGRLRHRIDCGWGVHPNYFGQGIGTRLMKELLKFAKEKKLKRVEAEIAVENIASVKLAEKMGFKIEGTKEKAILTDDGRYIDSYIVGKVLK